MLVCVASADNWKGRLTRWLTRSDVNHCFLLFESDLWGGWWAVNVDQNGIDILPAEKVVPQYSFVRYYAYQFPLKEGLAKSRSYIGTSYDWFGVFHLGVKLFFWKFLRLKILDPIQDLSRLFCSEFVMKVLKDAKVVGSEDYLASEATPRDVQELCERSDYFTQVLLTDFEPGRQP